MAYSQAWLESTSAIRGILVVATASVWSGVAWVETPMYLSNIGYVSGDASVVFNPVITGGVQFTESLSLDGSATLSFGDIGLNNPTGALDDWIDGTKYIWVNRAVKVYLGDPSWGCANLAAIEADFGLVFDGVIADIDSKNRETLNLKVRDKLERLNTPLTETVLGNTYYGGTGDYQTSQDTIRPLVFGEVFNMSPLLKDPSLPSYLVNSANTELVIELRDNGVPIYTHDGVSTTYDSDPATSLTLASGTVQLSYALAGALTASVQGVKDTVNLGSGALVSGTYENNIAKLIALIATQYGKASTRLTSADLDLANLATFAAANTQPVGVVISDKANTLAVCQSLASSIGAQVFMTRAGKLQLLRVGVPTSDASVSVTENDFLHHSLSISNKVTVTSAFTIGYCKNWTSQTNLTTGIPSEHKDLFAKSITRAIYEDSTVTSRYKLTTLSSQKETYLIRGVDAEAEALRLTTFYKTPRCVYKFTGLAKLLSLKLGQQITLTHARFGLSAGRACQVISLTPNWLRSTIDVEAIDIGTLT